jgi:ribosomal protein S8
MSFLRHVGKIGDRKVAIVFREVPNEPHMALVTFTESLNRHLHDPMMQCIESDIGQNSKNLADALNRTHTKDGKYILQVLHAEGLLKKVQTETVIVTPNSTTKIRLDELNKILTEMENGEDAIKRLAEINNSDTEESTSIAKKLRGDKSKITDAPQGVLGDNAIANNLITQARRMEAEAKGLLAESARLQKEASDMMGVPTTTQTTTSAPVAKKRGRPAKATVTA